MPGLATRHLLDKHIREHCRFIQKLSVNFIFLLVWNCQVLKAFVKPFFFGGAFHNWVSKVFDSLSILFSFDLWFETGSKSNKPSEFLGCCGHKIFDSSSYTQICSWHLFTEFEFVSLNEVYTSSIVGFKFFWFNFVFFWKYVLNVLSFTFFWNLVKIVRVLAVYRNWA